MGNLTLLQLGQKGRLCFKYLILPGMRWKIVCHLDAMWHTQSVHIGKVNSTCSTCTPILWCSCILSIQFYNVTTENIFRFRVSQATL